MHSATPSGLKHAHGFPLPGVRYRDAGLCSVTPVGSSGNPPMQRVGANSLVSLHKRLYLWACGTSGLRVCALSPVHQHL